MTPLSQRDPKWASKVFGDPEHSTSKIGDYGCLLTCLAMVSSLTPDVLNDKLVEVHGWQNDLLIWGKVKEAIPFDFKFPVAFDNDAVKQEIVTNGFCVVWVDFDGKITTPSDMHWVVYIGNQQMIDPWTGTTKSTGWYPLIKGYSPCTKLSLPQPTAPINPPDPMKVKVDLGQPFGIMEVQSIISKLNDLSRDLTAAQEHSKILDGFVSKWVAQWNLPVGSSLVEVEAEMTKLMPAEEAAQTFRDSIEACVGQFISDDILLDSHKLVRKQIEDEAIEISILQQKLADAKVPSGYKFTKSWNLFGDRYLVKMYTKAVK
jgi:hypothetical protein